MTAGDDDVLLSPEVCGHAAHVGSRYLALWLAQVCVCVCVDVLVSRLPSAASSFSFKIEMDCVAPFY